EISDVAEAGAALGAVSDIDGTKLAVVGHGFGGTLALLSAGARPGVYAAVAAIDPITDWSIELEHASVPWRNWVSRQYGMPLTDRDRYALRTPETFAGVIDVPLILVTTGRSMSRELQMQAFTSYLDDVGVIYELVEAREESIPAILQMVGRKLANQFLEGRDSVQVVDDLRADET
ncbi:MAG TPA: prolyl oligopeptidase family serine peptidase, partial [Thermomicrobiales bacterium]|nr:prolyl oligopeptidase family serine peptidase [Thermomicrobiales bacterium]